MPYSPTRHGQERFRYDQHFHYGEHVLPNLGRADSAPNLFFRRELEHIIPEMFNFEFARINARRIFPIDRSAGPTARTITWRQFTKTGQAQIVADYADDINVVNAQGEEFETKVRGLAVASQWSIQEIRSAQAEGRPLDRMYVEAARETMLRTENSIAFLGDAAFGLQGLFSAGTLIPTNAAPNGSWTVATQADRDNITEDMNFGANTIPETTGTVEAPTRMLLPPTRFNLIASNKHGVDSDKTLMKLFMDNSPYITEIVQVRELETAGPGGTPVMVCYEPNPSKLRMQIPLDIEQFAPQQDNMVIKTLYHMRVGGLTIHKPASLHIVTGI